VYLPGRKLSSFLSPRGIFLPLAHFLFPQTFDRTLLTPFVDASEIDADFRAKILIYLVENKFVTL
jgi:hypothetical protein